MRTVTITPSAGQAVVIGDDSLGRGVGSKLVLSLRPRFGAAVQQAAYVRGAAVDNFDRLNETADIIVEVAYCFSSYAACDEFLLGLQATIPRQGLLTISTSGATTRYLADAWARPIEVVEQVGVTAIVRYEFSGGKMTTT